MTEVIKSSVDFSNNLSPAELGKIYLAIIEKDKKESNPEWNGSIDRLVWIFKNNPKHLIEVAINIWKLTPELILDFLNKSRGNGLVFEHGPGYKIKTGKIEQRMMRQLNKVKAQTDEEKYIRDILDGKIRGRSVFN